MSEEAYDLYLAAIDAAEAEAFEAEAERYEAEAEA